jgi:hypothetical protein
MNFWPPIKTALESVFLRATGVPFVWQENARRILRPPIGILELGQSTIIGRDAHSYTFRDSDIKLDICGYRELSIGVQLVTRLAKNLPSSRELAEKARLALANPIYRDELRNAGLIFVESHPLVNLDYDRHRGKELRSSFDVVFRLRLMEQQPTKSDSFFEYGTIEGEFIEY